MKISAIMWDSHIPPLVRVSKELDLFFFTAYSSKLLEREPAKIEEALEELSKADLILLYRSQSSIWEKLEPKLKELGLYIPIICLSHEPSFWKLSTVDMKVVAKCQSYITIGGRENLLNLFRYIGRGVFGLNLDVEEPEPVPWEGVYHPDAPVPYFTDVEAYLEWYKPKDVPTVGILFSRYYWVNGEIAIEDFLIRQLESLELNVIPVFSYSSRDKGLGTKGSGEVILEYFIKEDGTPQIDALVKLLTFFLGRRKGEDEKLEEKENAQRGVEILKTLGVPVFQPVVSYYKTIDEWREDAQGLSSEISWSIAMPEFEGVIEPIIIGGPIRTEEEETGNIIQSRGYIEERCAFLCHRVKKWIKLRRKPPEERKVAFILHNNPCASVEATVGGGAHLDTLESVARILNRMKAEGYKIENPPKDGHQLIQTIMERKAISEFRWTTVDEIVSKGGVLTFVSLDEYLQWFNGFTQKVKERISSVWGNPPGEEMNGVPAAMVYDSKILVTGINFGNAVVCVQPKRGCAGPRCDGRVCKILHDPEVPPPHQYIATYRYLQDVFGADAIVHVGTHGNLEFLPGKSVGLSSSCYPDIAIDKLPHLYIYNADNPPEGTIAKRRSYAALVDHMQTVMTGSGLYDDLEELERYLDEYQQAKIENKGRAHSLEHLIIDAAKKANLDKGLKLADDKPFDEVVKQIHEALSLIKNTQIQDGMHIFGELPQGEDRIEFLNSILRYDAGDELSLRALTFKLMGLSLKDALENPGETPSGFEKTYGQLLAEVEEKSKAFIREFLNGNLPPEELAQKVLGSGVSPVASFLCGDNNAIRQLSLLREKVLDLNEKIQASKEMDSLLNGFSGRYIPAGPSGLITRGRADVLPTGRNFYSLDPRRVPTKAAWKVGQKLADALIEKHRQDAGELPENVAIYWMASDIMWADGEGMASMMSLIGVQPTWQPNSRIDGFKIIPLEELGRPRIDLTVRVSGIIRDNFQSCIELMDEAIQAVASLDEPLEMNFIRKHALEQMPTESEIPKSRRLRLQAWRQATLRIFSSKPQTYSAGVQLAVYASAWKEEKDLSDIFVYWNGYAYGKGIFGQESHQQLINSLSTVDVTYNKVVSDEYDLFGCCCYFGAHGGLTAAAKTISQKPVKTYYGDTREVGHVEVRDLADEIRRVVRTKL
ncbi:TPA: cobaltochelatase subunit CobN, partial [Candidatus Poribacteria bacterium]|nr:cobaltochelatase subunit CobN [Candidatus Poribacteria bacterium]